MKGVHTKNRLHELPPDFAKDCTTANLPRADPNTSGQVDTSARDEAYVEKVLVLFVGCCTSVELASLRELSHEMVRCAASGDQKYGGHKEILVAATSLTSSAEFWDDMVAMHTL